MSRRRPRRAGGRVLGLASLAAGLPGLASAQPAEWRGEYTADLIGGVAGGDRPGGGLLQKLLVVAEGEPRPGWSVLASLQAVGGAMPSARHVGDLQVIDNIEAPDSRSVSEAWIAHAGPDGRWRVRIGLIDLNRDFDVQEVGALFLNSSFGVGPDLSQTGVNGPSIFPRPGLAAATSWRPSAAWRVQLGVFDGAPGSERQPLQASLSVSGREGALVIGEAEFRRRAAIVRLGLWSYTAKVAAPGDEPWAPDAASWGGYAQMQTALPAMGPDGASRAWLRVGLGRGAYDPVAVSIGGGLVREGVWAPDDSLGLAFAHARFGAAVGRAEGRNAPETVVELTYGRRLGPGLQIQPDLQYVIHPGGVRERDAALVLGLRLRAEFGPL
jgi:porin